MLSQRRRLRLCPGCVDRSAHRTTRPADRVRSMLLNHCAANSAKRNTSHDPLHSSNLPPAAVTANRRGSATCCFALHRFSGAHRDAARGCSCCPAARNSYLATHWAIFWARALQPCSGSSALIATSAGPGARGQTLARAVQVAASAVEAARCSVCLNASCCVAHVATQRGMPGTPRPHASGLLISHSRLQAWGRRSPAAD